MGEPKWKEEHKEVSVLVPDTEDSSALEGEAERKHEDDLLADEMEAYEGGMGKEEREMAKKSMWRPYWLLLARYSSYRLLYCGNVVSRFGDSLNYIASVTLLGEISDSGLLLSLLLITRMLPRILLAPLVGVLADRFDRRKQMLVSDGIRFFVVLGFLFVRSPSSLWLLFVLSFLQFCFSALYEPSRSGLVPNLIDPADISTANTLDGATWSTMSVLASGVGGLVTSLFGTSIDFLLDALTYLGSVLFVAPLLWHPVLNKKEKRRTRKRREESGERGGGAYDYLEDVWVDLGGYSVSSSTWETVVELSEREDGCEVSDPILCDEEADDGLESGWHDSFVCNKGDAWLEAEYGRRDGRGVGTRLSSSAKAMLRNEGCTMFGLGCRFLQLNKYVLAMVCIKGSSQFIEGAVNTANIEFSQSVYDTGDGSALLGVLYAFMGVATFMGPVLAKRFGRETKHGTHLIFSLAFFVLAAGSLLLAMLPYLAAFLVVNMVRASGTSVCWVFASSMLQQICVDEYRGRILAFDLGFSTLCQAMGTLMTGVLLQLGFSPYACCLVVGVFASGAFCFWTAYFILKSHHYSRAIKIP